MKDRDGLLFPMGLDVFPIRGQQVDPGLFSLRINHAGGLGDPAVQRALNQIQKGLSPDFFESEVRRQQFFK